MRYGMCIQNTQLDYIEGVAKMGYDYIEGRFTLFAGDDEELIEKMFKLTKENNIVCETCNCFIPGDLRITGDVIDEKALSDYIEKGMKNLEKAGCKIVVFGSGGARNIPEGYDYEKGINQIAHFLKTIAGPIAEKYGITIVTEPLKNPDSNIINTVKEAVELAEKVNHPCVSSLADLYHMYAENETPESLEGYDGKVKHCHIAEVLNRAYPKSSDEYDYSRFIKVMEKIGCPRCSVEGSTKDFLNDSKAALEVLKSIEL